MSAWLAAAASAQAQADQPFNRLFEGKLPAFSRAATPALPAVKPALSADAARFVHAVFDGRAAAKRAWPGYDLLDKPLLAVFADGSAVLIDHPKPPAGYRPVAVAGKTVFVADKAEELGFSFDTDFAFHGAKVTAVRQDRAGEDTAELALLAAHEHFHLYQRGRDFTPDYASDDVEEGEDVALASEEGRALARWVEAADADAMRDFAALRRRRRALFPDTKDETSEENLEGTARYVEYAAKAGASGDAAARTSLLDELRRTLTLKEMPKGRAYGVGAALCRFLQSQAPGAWQSKVESGSPLSEIALARLTMSDAEAAARVARLTGTAEYAKVLAAARKDVQGFKNQRTQAYADFDAQAGTRVHLDTERGGGFSDDGAWYKRADGATLHAHVIEWVVEGPSSRFRATDRAVLSIGRGIEFYAQSPAVTLDGQAWDGRSGKRAFTELTLTAPGVTMTLKDGSLDYDGRVLSLSLAHPAR